MNQSTQDKKNKNKKHSCTQIFFFFFSITMIWNVLAEKYTAVTMETEIQAMFWGVSEAGFVYMSCNSLASYRG